MRKSRCFDRRACLYTPACTLTQMHSQHTCTHTHAHARAHTCTWTHTHTHTHTPLTPLHKDLKELVLRGVLGVLDSSVFFLMKMNNLDTYYSESAPCWPWWYYYAGLTVYVIKPSAIGSTIVPEVCVINEQLNAIGVGLRAIASCRFAAQHWLDAFYVNSKSNTTKKKSS